MHRREEETIWKLMTVAIDKIRVYSDPRGAVFEPLAPETLRAQSNAHVVVTEPGAVRGNHRHRIGMETVVVYGPALVRIREGRESKESVVAEGECVRFTIPPGVSHAFKNIGCSPNLLVCFNTRAYDPQHSDTENDVLIED